jgi:hypothetical protein
MPQLTQKQLKNLLYLYVSGDNYEKTNEFFALHPGSVDPSDDFGTGDDGILFGISLKSPKLLKLLIDEYITTKLQGDTHSVEFLAAKVKLKSMLEEQIDTSAYEFEKLDKEIQAILIPWMPENVDSEVDEQDLGNLDDVFLEDGDDHNGAYSGQEQQAPEFCVWPEALVHRHLSGDSPNGFTEVH